MTELELTELNDQSFESFVAADEPPALVAFCAADHSPCQMLEEQIAALGRRYADRIRLARIDVDANPQTRERYGIVKTPTSMLFPAPPHAPQRASGYMSAEELAKQLKADQLLPDPTVAPSSAP